MGRVYDALKRAEGQPRVSNSNLFGRDGKADNVAYTDWLVRAEHPWDVSPFTAMPVVISSASTAHTEEVTGGPALPGGPASRDAGATLGRCRIGARRRVLVKSNLDRARRTTSIRDRGAFSGMRTLSIAADETTGSRRATESTFLCRYQCGHRRMMRPAINQK